MIVIIGMFFYFIKNVIRRLLFAIFFIFLVLGYISGKSDFEEIKNIAKN